MKPTLRSIAALLPAGLLMLLALSLPAGPARAALDVRLLLDISDSMDQTDPEGLRGDALAALIDLLPDGSRAGVWSFGEEVNRLIAPATVTELWRVQAKARTAAQPAVGLFSVIDRAIEAASWDLAEPASGPRHLILLTDGDLEVAADPAVNRAAERRLLEDTLPALAAQGIRVHTLALTAAANASLLRRMAQLTGGRHVDVGAPAALTEAMAALYGAIGGTDELPAPRAGGGSARAAPRLVAAQQAAARVVAAAAPAPAVADAHLSKGPSKEPGAAAVREFRVDSGVESITVIAFMPPTQPSLQALQLTDPTGARFDRAQIPPGSRWHVGRNHEVLTLAQPRTGRWQLSGAENARVFVHGDLLLRLANAPTELAPAALHRLVAVLIDRRSGAPVEPAFARLLRWRAAIDSESKRPKAAVEVDPDGTVNVLLSDLDAITEGTLRVTVTGRTFDRSLQHAFRVTHPLRAELQPPQVEGAGGGRLWVTVDQAGLDLRSVKLVAALRQPPAAPRYLPLNPEPGGLWSLTLAEGAGARELKIDVQGDYYDGGSFAYQAGPVKFRLPLTAVERLSFDSQGRLRRIAAGAAVVPRPAASAVAEPALERGAELTERPDRSPSAATPAPATPPAIAPEVRVPGWFAGLSLLVPLLIALFVWWLLGRRQIALPTLTPVLE